MRYASVIATGVLLSTALFTSCTCEKAVPPPPTTTSDVFEERPGLGKAPAKQAAAPTATAGKAPERVAAAPTAPAVAPELPHDFPSEVPVFKGAALSQVQDLPNDAHNVIFSTSAPVSDVMHFYHDQLSKAGWHVTQQFDRPNHAFMTYQKGNMQANVTIAEDTHNPGQQVIAIMYEEQKPLDFDEF